MTLLVKTPDGVVAEAVRWAPAEDPDLGTLTSIDTVTVEYADGTQESFWSVDLEVVSPGIPRRQFE